jgi:hypothetical protein
MATLVEQRAGKTSEGEGDECLDADLFSDGPLQASLDQRGLI